MEVPKNVRHIHMIAICGTGMGSLAGLFKQKGFIVSGSDQNTYPPMSTELEALGVKLFQGYRAENLQHPDLVIVGNAVSKDNPEVEEMLRLNIPHLSMPEALSRYFIEGKQSIVVSGTHGKTTISALLSHLLLELEADPSFLYAGVPQGGGKNYRMGQGKYFVIEGDEYDTAFFDKGPKFLHYQPYYTIITSLEFDHADIYLDLDHVSSSFEALVKIVNPNGYLLFCSDYPSLRRVIASGSEAIPRDTSGDCHALRARNDKHDSYRPVFENYGLNQDALWRPANITFTSTETSFDILYKGKKEIRLTSPLSGEHNVLNVLASFALLKQLGFKNSDIQKALLTFRGVKRRQEVRAIVGDVVVIDDFAHHPTAVRETIDAIKNKYAGHKIWAIFEPRSNTSIRNIFQKEFAEAFDRADAVILSDVFRKKNMENILDVDQLAIDISKRGVPAEHISGVENIVEHLAANMQPRSVALIMSNGGFGGIHEKLIERLKSKMDPGLRPPG